LPYISASHQKVPKFIVSNSSNSSSSQILVCPWLLLPRQLAHPRNSLSSNGCIVK
jgi:hypothetical protein